MYNKLETGALEELCGLKSEIVRLEKQSTSLRKRAVKLAMYSVVSMANQNKKRADSLRESTQLIR